MKDSMGLYAFTVLGIGTDADEAAVRSRFRALAKQWHPDSNGSPEAEKIFRQYKEAYDAALKICRMRKVYWQNREGTATHARYKAAPEAGTRKAETVWNAAKAAEAKKAEEAGRAEKERRAAEARKAEEAVRKMKEAETARKAEAAAKRQAFVDSIRVELDALFVEMERDRRTAYLGVFDQRLEKTKCLTALLQAEQTVVGYYGHRIRELRSRFVEEAQQEQRLLVEDTFLGVSEEISARNQICTGKLRLFQSYGTSEDASMKGGIIQYYAKVYRQNVNPRILAFGKELAGLKKEAEERGRLLSLSALPMDEKIRRIKDAAAKDAFGIIELLEQEADRLAFNVILYECDLEQESLYGIRDQLVDQYADYIHFYGEALRENRVAELLSDNPGMDGEVAESLARESADQAVLLMLRGEVSRLREDRLIPLTPYETWRGNDLVKAVNKLRR